MRIVIKNNVVKLKLLWLTLGTWPINDYGLTGAIQNAYKEMHECEMPLEDL